MGTPDRLTHEMTPRDGVDRTRIVKFEVRGQTNVFKVFTHAYSREQTPGSGVYGAGRITVKEYDGDAQKVQGSSCVPPPGVTAPFGKWRLAPQTGVSASWWRNAPPGVTQGTTHEITIEAESTSSFPDDIEWDIGIETGPGLMHCADGVGCVMNYTVVEVHSTCPGLDDSEEKSDGVFVAFEKGGSNATAVAPFTMQKVLPLTLSGYALEAQVFDHTWTSTDIIELADGSKSAWSSPATRGVNGGLPYAAYVRGVEDCVHSQDSRCRIRLVVDDQDREEVGDDTCRDWFAVTSVEYEVVNPTQESGGSISTPVYSSSGEGNEFAFDASSTGVLDIEWRMKLRPDDSDVRTAYEGMMTYTIDSVGSSTLSWPDGQTLEYAIAYGRWDATARFSGLPSSNTAFGQKTCTVTIASPSSGDEIVIEREIEVFYSGTATNHGLGGSAPNWFMYYKQAVGGGSFGYDADGSNGDGRSYSSAGGGESSIFLANSAYTGGSHINTTIDATSGLLRVTDPPTSATYQYFAYFCGVLEHERQHATNEVTGGASAGDPDQDFLTSSFENATSLTVPSGPNAKYSADPDGLLGSDDGEVYAGGPVEEAGIHGADLTKDWAYPGSNWGN